MNPTGIGAALAAVLVGPRLLAMVQTGELSLEAALLRGLLVAGVCVAGMSFIASVIRDYHEQTSRQKAIAELTAQIEAMAAETKAAEAAETEKPKG